MIVKLNKKKFLKLRFLEILGNFVLFIIDKNIGKDYSVSTLYKSSITVLPNNYIDVNPNSIFYFIGIILILLVQILSFWTFFLNYNEVNDYFIFKNLKLGLFIFDKIKFVKRIYIDNKVFYLLLKIILIEFLLIIIFLYFYKVEFSYFNISLIFCLISIIITSILFFVISRLYTFNYIQNFLLVKKEKILEIEKNLILIRSKLEQNKNFKNKKLIDLEIKKLRKIKLFDLELEHRIPNSWRPYLLDLMVPNGVNTFDPIIFKSFLQRPGMIQLFFLLTYFYYIYICYFNSYNYFFILF